MNTIIDKIKFISDLKPSRVFAALMCLYGIVILFTVWDYGITVDEGQHILYGKSVLDWYLSGFTDRWMFTWIDVWLYGGFYDLTSYLITRISLLDLYDTRHLFNALFGMLGVWAAYRLGCLLGSGWAGVLAALFLILTPRYYGHAFNNHKDLPFAVLYLWGICWQVKVLKALPHAPWQWIIATGLVTGLAMGIRVGGTLLICYMGLFWFLRYVQMSDRHSIRRYAIQYIAQTGIAFFLAYIIMLLFWPWAQTDPLTHPYKALTAFSQFHNIIMNFFEGQYVPSNEVPWYFAPKWMLLTLPEFVLLGLLSTIAIFFFKQNKVNKNLSFFLVGFASFFPLIYASTTGLSLYNGVRHVLFTLPPLVILSAVSAHNLAAYLKGWPKILFGSLVALCMTLTLIEMVILHPYQAIYFNRIVAGGFEKATQSYDTDYWHNAYKEGFQWLQNHVRNQARDKSFRLSSNGGNMQYQTQNTSFTLVPNPWNADFHLASSHHHQHALTPGEILHTVKRRDLPLLYVIRPDSSYINDPLFGLSRLPNKDLTLALHYENIEQNEKALEAWKKAIEKTPTAAFPQARIGRWYIHLKKYEQAIPHLEKALEIGPPQTTWYFLLGRCYQDVKQYQKSVPLFENALAMRPNYLGALRGLGESLFFLGDYDQAIHSLKQVVLLYPTSSSDHQLLATAYYYANQIEEAVTSYQKSVTFDPNNLQAQYGLGVALHRIGKIEEAEQAYLQTLKQHANHRNTLFKLSTLHFEQMRYETAIRILTRLLSAHPTDWEGYFKLGKAYEALDKKEVAKQIYRQSLQLNPNQPDLRSYLESLN